MDITVGYIKMCQKAHEIQQKWEPQDWDWVNGVRNGDRGSYVLSGYETDGGFYGPYLIRSLTGGRAEIEGIENSIWLPRQDQLQEMLHPEAVFHLLEVEYLSRSMLHASLEQVWLAWVMKSKFKKVWDGKDWVNTERRIIK